MKERPAKRQRVEKDVEVAFEMVHSACFDAFMTGYVFAYAKAQSSEFEEWKNKIYLIGKGIPLGIVQSLYARPSALVKSKMRL